MPENNSMPYDRHRKEKGWDRKSIIAFHSHSTSHPRDFTCFGFQRGISQDLIVQFANCEPLYSNALMYVCLYMQEQEIEFCQDWYLKITNDLTSYVASVNFCADSTKIQMKRYLQYSNHFFLGIQCTLLFSLSLSVAVCISHFLDHTSQHP